MAADPLVDVPVGLCAEFGEHATLGEVLAGVDRCRRDLDTVDHPASPETRATPRPSMPHRPQQ